jgi:hypothetical protein
VEHAIIVFLCLGPLFYLQSSLWESLFHEYVLDVRPWRRVARFERSKWLRTWWFGARYFLLPVYLNLVWVAVMDNMADVVAVVLADFVFAMPFVLFSKVVHPCLHMRFNEAVEGAPWPLRKFLASRYGLAMRVLHYVHHRLPTRNFCLQIGADILRGRWQPPAAQDWEVMIGLGLIAPEHKAMLLRRPVLWHPFHR